MQRRTMLALALWLGPATAMPAQAQQPVRVEGTPSLAFTPDMRDVLRVADYTLIRPRLDPGFATLANVEMFVDKVERLEEDNSWKRLNAETFQLQWAHAGATVTKVDRLALPTTFALFRVWTKEPNRAGLAVNTAFGTWNGDLGTAGKYRLHLLMVADGRAPQLFTALFTWRGSTDNFDLAFE